MNDGQGLVEIAPSGEAPESFFEPFSGTAYWERQEQRLRLPADGAYTVAVWHEEGASGRYVFVIGDKERPGGDPLFPVKMKAYWTPVSETKAEPEATAGQIGHWWDWIARMLGVGN